jgi:uncharacterized protein (DUF2249 family)
MSDEQLDIRPVPGPQKHSTIFAKYGALGAGHSFVLVNDHDPRPLQYQFEAEHKGQYTWKYLEEGPEVWRVEIGKP